MSCFFCYKNQNEDEDNEDYYYRISENQNDKSNKVETTPKTAKQKLTDPSNSLLPNQLVKVKPKGKDSQGSQYDHEPHNKNGSLESVGHKDKVRQRQKHTSVHVNKDESMAKYNYSFHEEQSKSNQSCNNSIKLLSFD